MAEPARWIQSLNTNAKCTKEEEGAFLHDKWAKHLYCYLRLMSQTLFMMLKYIYMYITLKIDMMSHKFLKVLIVTPDFVINIKSFKKSLKNINKLHFFEKKSCQPEISFIKIILIVTPNIILTNLHHLS